jgi:biopolymer transport protein ExbD
LRKVLVERNAPLIKILRDLEAELAKANETDTATINRIERESKKAQQESKLVVLLKHDNEATYENVIDVIDEFLITQIAKYFVVEDNLAEMETELLKKLNVQ